MCLRSVAFCVGGHLFRFLPHPRRIRFCLLLNRIRSYYCFFVTFAFRVPGLRGRPLLFKGSIRRPICRHRPFLIRRLLMETQYVKNLLRFKNRLRNAKIFSLTAICHRVSYRDRTVNLGEARLQPLIALIPGPCRHFLRGVLYLYPVRHGSRNWPGRLVLRQRGIVTGTRFLRLWWVSNWMFEGLRPVTIFFRLFSSANSAIPISN